MWGVQAGWNVEPPQSLIKTSLLKLHNRDRFSLIWVHISFAPEERSVTAGSLTMCVSGGAGPGEGAGDEEVGSVGDPGQRGGLPRPPGGPSDCTRNFKHTLTAIQNDERKIKTMDGR